MVIMSSVCPPPSWQVLAICMLTLAGSIMAENDNLSMSSVSNSEVFKVGNTKTNNYHYENSNIRPTQLTQVVLNVPKLGKKLRKTRQPTVEEMAIKNEILKVYEMAREETANVFSIHFEHLGRIIKALNPKYIATERVRRVAFANPRDPNSLIPLPEFDPTQVDLASVEAAPLDKLNLLVSKFNELVSWDESVVEQFASLPDGQLEPGQLAFKQAILCLSGHRMCVNHAAPDQLNQFIEEPSLPVVAAERPPYNHAYNQQAPIQRPRSLIPEEVKQRYYIKQQPYPSQGLRNGQIPDPRMLNARGGSRHY